MARIHYKMMAGVMIGLLFYWVFPIVYFAYHYPAFPHEDLVFAITFGLFPAFLVISTTYYCLHRGRLATVVATVTMDKEDGTRVSEEVRIRVRVRLVKRRDGLELIVVDTEETQDQF